MHEKYALDMKKTSKYVTKFEDYSEQIKHRGKHSLYLYSIIRSNLT